jgi:hypothetical protein
MNSRSVAVATATHSLAFPVNSIFSNAETLIPLGMMVVLVFNSLPTVLLTALVLLRILVLPVFKILNLFCDIVDFERSECYCPWYGGSERKPSY